LLTLTHTILNFCSRIGPPGLTCKSLIHWYELYSCSPAFQRKPGDTQNSLLVIQCDSGHLNADLIACARYRIYDKRAEASQRNKVFRTEGHTHVLFTIHLPRQVLSSSLVGFQGDPWISTHIDVLRPMTYDMITLHEAMGMSISHLFYNKGSAIQFRRLHGCIQSAASRLQDSSTNKARATKRVAILVSLIPRNPSFPLGMQCLMLKSVSEANIVLFRSQLFSQLNCSSIRDCSGFLNLRKLIYQ